MAQGPDNEPDDAALRARLGKLSSSLSHHDTADDAASSKEGGDAGFGSAMGLAARAVTELVAGVVVGGGLGYLLDMWLNTKPFLLILFLILGTIGGFWNIVRSALLPPGGPKRFN